MGNRILVVAVTSLTVFICARDVESTQCECLCTSASIDDEISLTVSGTYCKSDGAFVDDGNVGGKCPQSCDKKWRVATYDAWCICVMSTSYTLCKCPGNSARDSSEVSCACNFTNNAMEIPQSVTTDGGDSKDISTVADQTVHVVNATGETPQKLPPRKYSPVGVGLGVTFGLAAIITIVLVLLFFYRRRKESTENHRKTPEVPVYDSTLEGESRPTWTSHRGSVDNPTYKENNTDTKIPPVPSQDLSQDSSTHYTALQLNDRGMSNGGYADAEKPHNGHSTSWDTDEHEYQGLYTEPKGGSIPRTDSEVGYISPGSSLGDSLGEGLGDSLQRGTKLSAAEDTDSSEPYYIKLNRDDMSSDQSPCLDIPNLGIYSGSTSGDSGDYEQLQLNREDFHHHPPPLPQRVDEDEEVVNDGYGIMVMEDRVGDADPPDDEEYDHLDRGPLGSSGIRPLG